MKSIIFLLGLLLAGFAVKAQGYVGQITGPSADTLTNAATQSYTLEVKGAKTAVTFQYNVAKISGTVGGTVKVLGSIDGTNYVQLNSYTVTDASQIGAYSMATNGYTKYKVTVTTTGTQVSSYDIWALYR